MRKLILKSILVIFGLNPIFPTNLVLDDNIINLSGTHYFNNIILKNNSKINVNSEGLILNCDSLIIDSSSVIYAAETIWDNTSNAYNSGGGGFGGNGGSGGDLISSIGGQSFGDQITLVPGAAGAYPTEDSYCYNGNHSFGSNGFQSGSPIIGAGGSIVAIYAKYGNINGQINVNGGDGDAYWNGCLNNNSTYEAQNFDSYTIARATGGGSGGMIFLEIKNLFLNGYLNAQGGHGGNATNYISEGWIVSESYCGGGGAGGRVTIITDSFIDTSRINLDPGSGGSDQLNYTGYDGERGSLKYIKNWLISDTHFNQELFSVNPNPIIKFESFPPVLGYFYELTTDSETQPNYSSIFTSLDSIIIEIPLNGTWFFNAVPVDSNYIILEEYQNSYQFNIMSTGIGIESPSHPNSSFFYNNQTIVFNFDSHVGINQYYYVINSIAEAEVNEENGIYTNNTELILTNINPGTYYLHVASIDNFGFVNENTSHFQINIGQPGCIDIEACNYNPEANADDGSCWYSNEGCTCDNSIGAVIDECGICEGQGYIDNCGVCDDNPYNDCDADCNGDWGGEAYIDDCGLCVGGGTGLEPNMDMDCNGDCGGNAIENECGCVLGFTGNAPDFCYGCIDNTACNYDDQAFIDDESCYFTEGTCGCDGLPLAGFCDCNGNINDCNGDCGGSAFTDDCGICSEGFTGNIPNLADSTGFIFGHQADCNGICFGFAELDCNGDCLGSAFIDDCGVCADGETEHQPNSNQDCSGMCFGTAYVDDCGLCVAGLTGILPNTADTLGFITGPAADCSGVCFGNAQFDNCGVCDNNPLNDCSQDCNGVFGGNADFDCAGICGGLAFIDSCGFCSGGTTGMQPNISDSLGVVTGPAADCNGVCFGDAYLDMCGECNSDPTNDCMQDCTGTWGGSAVEDQCGVCDIDPSNDCTQDCEGNWGGTAEEDACGICNGQNIDSNGYFSGPDAGCDGVCFSGLEIDFCGECGGNNDCMEDAPPIIDQVVDIPQDQGGFVGLQYQASVFDYMNLGYDINFYSFWRSLDVEPESGSVSTLPNTDYYLNNRDDYWELVGEMPALNFETYGFTAPTLVDSSVAGLYWSKFMVIAHTDNEDIFFESLPDSGYSVDNLAPGSPDSLTATVLDGYQAQLTWLSSDEADLSHYALYRWEELEMFPTDPIITLTDTMYIDMNINNDEQIYYAISAFDHNGNESVLSDIVYVNLLDITQNNLPESYILYDAYPNPFNPVTNIKYSVPENAYVSIAIYDINGNMISELMNQNQSIGTYNIMWNAVDHPSGLYFVKMTANNFMQTQKIMLLK